MEKAQVGYPLLIHPEDKRMIRFDGKTRTPNMDDLARVIGARALHVVLKHYHHLDQDQLRRMKQRVVFVKRPTLQTRTGKDRGLFVRIVYRFTDRPKRDYYVHVFRFTPDSGSLDGTLFTHYRRHHQQA